MPTPRESSSFEDYVRGLEDDPEEKAALDRAREEMRRKLDEGDEESHAPA